MRSNYFTYLIFPSAPRYSNIWQKRARSASHLSPGLTGLGIWNSVVLYHCSDQAEGRLTGMRRGSKEQHTVFTGNKNWRASWSLVVSCFFSSSAQQGGFACLYDILTTCCCWMYDPLIYGGSSASEEQKKLMTEGLHYENIFIISSRAIVYKWETQQQHNPIKELWTCFSSCVWMCYLAHWWHSKY